MIILISGYARSGKDSVANYLCKHYSYQKESFAKPIKEVAKTIFGWNDSHVDGDNKETLDENWGISPRQFLQHFGTDFMQEHLCSNFEEFRTITGRYTWVKSLWERIDINKPYVIADFRFPHEYMKLKELCDGSNVPILSIQVTRPNLDKSETHSHKSESHVEYLPKDITIVNDSTLENLYEKIEEFLEDYIEEIY